MPEEVKSWRCKYCGQTWEKAGHARVCEDSHVDPSDLHLLETLADDRTLKYYPENPFPHTLVLGNKQGKRAEYVLVTGVKTTVATGPLKDRKIRLRPR